MSVGSTLTSGRRLAESLMTDTCTVTEVTGQTWDEASMTYTETRTTRYEGKCRLAYKGGTPSASSASAGEATWQVGEFPLWLPLDASTEAVGPGQRVELTASQHNPALVGHMFGIVAPDRQSQPTRRDFKVKEVVGD